MRERTRLASQVDAVKALERDLADALGYAELADEEGDESSLDEARAQLKAIKERAGRAELEALLAGEADGNDAFVEINSGAGGTESNDWAGMLLRMYTRWANAHGMEVEFLEETAGEQAGIKSATLQVKGPNAYGWLKTEGGVHRLVRISPFDSAVRLTHIPTGIAVACQAGRSQHQNREEAWKMLRARLYEMELQKREAAAQALEDQKTDIGWGHQIRSYVLQPYQMVKDLRTEVETSDTQGVLDGDLDAFRAASLAQRVGVTRDAAPA